MLEGDYTIPGGKEIHFGKWNADGWWAERSSGAMA
jgi:hypothetical protein